MISISCIRYALCDTARKMLILLCFRKVKRYVADWPTGSCSRLAAVRRMQARERVNSTRCFRLWDELLPHPEVKVQPLHLGAVHCDIHIA